jgi:hypothetical protein
MTSKLSRSIRILLAALFAFVILIATVALYSWVSFTAYFPRYPGARDVELCDPIQLFSYGDSIDWHLESGLCFQTNDDPEEVDNWLGQVSWSGADLELDRFGNPIIRSWRVGEFEFRLVRRKLQMGNQVMIESDLEFSSPTCTPCPWLTGGGREWHARDFWGWIWNVCILEKY